MKTLAAELIPNLLLWSVFIGAFWAPRPRLLRPLAVLLTVAAIPAVPGGLSALWAVDAAEAEGLSPAPAGAVMVFGGGIEGGPSLGYYPNTGTMRRAAAGAALAARYDLPLFVSGGRTLDDAPAEASVAIAHLRALGRTGVMVADDTARNTWENALAAKAALARHGWTGVIAVTDAGHARRARACLRAAGVPVVAMVVPQITPRDTILLERLLPRVGGLQAWRGPGYEIAAAAVYVATGRIGFADLF